MSELRGLGVVNRELQNRGGRMVAISADKISDAKRVQGKLGLSFDVLSDPELNVVRAYGLFFREPHRDADVAIPAHFLIDNQGIIRWRFVSPRSTDRPDPADVISEIEKL